MGDIERLMGNNTKEELRERAYSRDMSVPRGASKRDIAAMLVESDDGSGTCTECGGRAIWYLVRPGTRELKCTECGSVIGRETEGSTRPNERVSIGGRDSWKGAYR